MTDDEPDRRIDTFIEHLRDVVPEDDDLESHLFVYTTEETGTVGVSIRTATSKSQIAVATEARRVSLDVLEETVAGLHDRTGGDVDDEVVGSEGMFR